MVFVWQRVLMFRSLPNPEDSFGPWKSLMIDLPCRLRKALDVLGETGFPCASYHCLRLPDQCIHRVINVAYVVGVLLPIKKWEFIDTLSTGLRSSFVLQCIPLCVWAHRVEYSHHTCSIYSLWLPLIPLLL